MKDGSLQMSATRLIVRLFLVVALVAVCVVVFSAWRKSKPEYYTQRIERALKADRPAEAKIDALNMVERFPKEPQAHYLLAQAILAEAKAKDEPATYGRRPEALARLTEAAKLAPEDVELQREVVRAYVNMGQPMQAVAFATNLNKKEPDDLDALWVLAVQNVANNNSAALAQLEKLRAKEYRPFQVRGMTASYYARKKKDMELQDVLTESA